MLLITLGRRGAGSKEVCDYFEGGAQDEITLRENTAGWERLKLYYRILAEVGERDMSTTVLGQSISMPIVVAPTSFHKLACEAGEVATARAAQAAGTLFILGLLSNVAMEPVFAQAASPRWVRCRSSRFCGANLMKRCGFAAARSSAT